MTSEATFSVIEIGGTRTYAVKIPDTTEGIAMLDEVGRMFSHRGMYGTAQRIAKIVTDRKQELHSGLDHTLSSQESKSSIRKTVKATQICARCGQDRDHINHKQNTGRHMYHRFKP